MAFDPDKITFFAETDARGQRARFGIKAKDRQRHMYIIGKTGMGKSTVLENMAVQDIQNGEGMAFIDPHGSAAETLLNYIPEHRINDVLYFAPFDTENPISFNIMEDVGPDKRHLVVSGLMSVFKKIWIDAWSARMEYILSNTLLALLEYPGSTLLGVNRMLSDKDYRKLVVDNVKDPGVRSFWVDEFAKYNERYMQEAGDAIKNKIGQFTSNPIIRNIVGQPKSSFDIRKMMDEQKILIINLSKGLIGESNANLLGSMLTTRIYLAAMSRADIPPEKMREMPNFYFYVDEFQSFANATFANILSEARKYHLNLTIAHQYVTQMEEEVRDAVFGNVGTIISFRVGPLDAELLETIFTPQFLAADIVNLSFAQIYLTLMIDGIGSQPFSAVTLPPIPPPTASCKEMAISASRVKFTKPRADVEIDIHKFHEPVVVPRKFEARSGTDSKPKGAVYVKKDAYPIIPSAVVPKVQPAPVHTPTPVEKVEEQTPPTPAPVESRKVETKPAERVERETPRNDTPQKPRENTPRSNRPVYEKKPFISEKPAPARIEKQKQTSSEDLREILRKMVQNPPTPTKEKPAPEAKRDSEGLKKILQATYTPQTQTHSTQSSQPKPPEPATAETPKVAKEPVPKMETRTPLKSVSTHASASEVTPKELERMMRVTTSDKPPV